MLHLLKHRFSVGIRTILREQRGGEGHGQRHLSAPLWAAEHDGMGHSSVAHHLEQSLFCVFLTYYLVESHNNRLVTSLTDSTADTV